MTPSDMLDRLLEATNDHDLDTLVDCFDAHYVLETPAHPARNFRGRDQVRTNWQQIFAGVPDLTARMLDRAVAGDTVWSEWEISGTRADGARYDMRGVVVFNVQDGRATAGRFFLEPIDHSSEDVNAAIRAAVGSSS